MQEKTRGIVLHSTKYADSGVILTVYTSSFGRVSYAINGVHRKKSVVRPAFLQPLSIVEMEVTHLPGREIQRLKEIRPAQVFAELPFDPVKNAIAIFISEVLYRILKHREPDEMLFDFLWNAIIQLDECRDGLANFHPLFLCRLSRYLGIEPNAEEEDCRYFDLQNGVFQNERPLHVHYVFGDDAALFRSLLVVELSGAGEIVMSRQGRVKMLETLIEYYRLHIPEFHGVKSLSVLHSLFE